MFKRLSMLAIALMLIAVMASCGGKTDNTGTDTGTSDAGQQSADAGEKTEVTQLIVGFVPSQEAENLEAKAEPLAQLLTDKLGVPVKVFVSTNYNGLIEAMGSGKTDIGFLNPAGYVTAKEKGYADVLLKAVRNGSDAYRAQFVVLNDSPIQSIEDIKGKKIAFVDPQSTSGYIYPSIVLKEHGIDPETDVQATMAGGHDKAILALLRGDVDVAVSFDDARTIVEKTDPDVMNKTRILAYTEDIPNDTISVRSDMSEEWKQKIKDAFLAIAEDPEGKQIIQDIYSHDGYAEAKDSDFDVVRKANEMMNK